ncbi:MAG: hypothetical protein J6X86_02770 [Bacteroidales bacterium]|nr:hypothetical protein [Bacteroidales bacterium]
MSRQDLKINDLVEIWQQEGDIAREVDHLTEDGVRHIVNSSEGVSVVASMQRRRVAMACAVIVLLVVAGATLFVGRSSPTGGAPADGAPLLAQTQCDTPPSVCPDNVAIPDSGIVAQSHARRHGTTRAAVLPVPLADTMAKAAEIVGAPDEEEVHFYTKPFEGVLCSNLCDTAHIINNIDRLLYGENT